MKTAIVHGCDGKLGGAFSVRLLRDGFHVIGVDKGTLIAVNTGPSFGDLYLFDCAYEHGKPGEHITRVATHLAMAMVYKAIFVPSSMWIAEDTPYGVAKRAVEEMARLSRRMGNKVVTDRIGYFPGDDVEPDPNDPYYSHLVTGEELYQRVMKEMLSADV